MRRIYAARRDALAAALARHLGGAIAFRVPDGGMALWARANDGIDVAAWARASEREGVLFCDSREYDFFHREQPFLRLGFTYHDESELEEAVRRMARALAKCDRSGGQTKDMAAKPPAAAATTGSSRRSAAP